MLVVANRLIDVSKHVIRSAQIRVRIGAPRLQLRGAPIGVDGFLVAPSKVENGPQAVEILEGVGSNPDGVPQFRDRLVHARLIREQAPAEQTVRGVVVRIDRDGPLERCDRHLATGRDVLKIAGCVLRGAQPGIEPQGGRHCRGRTIDQTCIPGPFVLHQQRGPQGGVSERKASVEVNRLLYESLTILGVLGLGRKESLKSTGLERRYERLDPVERLYRRTI